jgi:hypothetical protein
MFGVGAGVNQFFSKHCSCHFQSGYVVGELLVTYIGQAVDSKTDSIVLNGGVEEWAAIQWREACG